MSKSREIFFFGIAGVFAYLADLLTTILFQPLLGVYGARLPAFIVAAFVAWILNRTFTFTNKSKHESLIKEYLHYLSLMTIGLIANYLAYAAVITILKEKPYSLMVSIGVGSLAGMMVNYTNSKKHIFNK